MNFNNVFKSLCFVSLFYLLSTLVSCNNKDCLPIRLNLLPYDSLYYVQPLFYTNLKDTIEFKVFNNDNWSSNAYGVCVKRYELSLFNKEKSYKISYFLTNESKYGNVIFSMFINGNELIKNIRLDKKLFNKKKTVFLNSPKIDSVDSFNRFKLRIVKLENMRVKMFQCYSGEKWFLIKVGYD